MRRKFLYLTILVTLIGALLPGSTASAATVKNGVLCNKSGATIKVVVKGKTKIYVCRVNPAIEGETKRSWTLKTCVTYWNTAKGSQKSIDEQRALVQVMSDPDKSTYMSELDKSQAELNKVLDAIKSNHCKAGL